MIILPSRGRPEQLARFFERSKPHERGLLLLDEDDTPSHEVPIPDSWLSVIGPRRANIEWCNQGFKMLPSEPWYACMGDDMECSPEGWDTALARAAGSWGLAWGDDGINGGAHPAIPFLGGDLVRAVGWIAPPGMRHGLYFDNLWHDIARAVSTATYHPEIKTIHNHWTTGRQAFDATARERPLAGDQDVYARFHQGGEFAALVARLRREMRIAA